MMNRVESARTILGTAFLIVAGSVFGKREQLLKKGKSTHTHTHTNTHRNRIRKVKEEEDGRCPTGCLRRRNHSEHIRV